MGEQAGSHRRAAASKLALSAGLPTMNDLLGGYGQHKGNRRPVYRAFVTVSAVAFRSFTRGQEGRNPGRAGVWWASPGLSYLVSADVS
jgi:hypothetical protein